MDKSTTPEPTMNGKRGSSRVEPIEAHSILEYGTAIAARPSPVEHVMPTSPAHSTSSSGRTSFQSHGRSMSTATETSTNTRTNRFSTSFPVQTSDSSSPTRSAKSPTRPAQAVVPEAIAAPTGPTDSSFLTAIATQERRVLELKEELQKAEADLVKLKRQWAQHEASKKRNDARRVTKLQPLQTALPTADKEEDTDGSSAWMQQEMERRKAIMNGSRTSNRTVFSGSRHTRTLSLLSPARDDNRPAGRQPLPPRKESLSSVTTRTVDKASSHARPQLVARASTTPDLTTEVVQSADTGIDLSDNLEKAIDREMLIRTGKKMASDLKDGFWTFVEDLRQATVGEDATQGMQVAPAVRKQGSNQSLRSARKKDSRSSLRPSSRGSTVSKHSTDTKRPPPVRRHTKAATQSAVPDLADPSFWIEHGVISTPATPATVKKSPTVRGHAKHASKAASVASNDAWDTWDDSPKPDSRSSSAASDANTLPSTVSGHASPRPSMEKKDPIPWPALSKLGPATLRRTASHLMSEWEKSLTPSPGKEFTGQEDYLGLDAEAAATFGTKKD